MREQVATPVAPGKPLSRRKRRMDYSLLAASMGLLAIGLIMVFSSSAIWAERNLGNSFYYLQRQLVSAVIGLCLMAYVSRFNYNRLKEWMGPILAITIMGLIAVLFTSPVKGVRRWIQLGPIGIQPSEFAKLTVILFLAYYLDRKRSKIDSPTKGLMVPIAVIMVILGLIGLGPDLGTPVLMFGVTILMIFLGGGKVRYLAAAAAAAIPLVVYELLKYPYRRQRLFNFLSPFADAQGSGYQLAQSLLAVGSGGWFGKGIGGSKLKLMYLPAPHTDFIFPVICEELGFLGAVGCLALFVFWMIRGIKIARQAPNLFGTLLAAGITFTVGLQAFFNIGMSLGLLPTKGLPLPFVSFGRSSLVATLIAVGILLNISRQANPESRA